MQRKSQTVGKKEALMKRFKDKSEFIKRILNGRYRCSVSIKDP